MERRAPETIVATRRDFIARRKQIANEMAAIPIEQRLSIIGEFAAKYGVCNMTVRLACKEFRVTIPRMAR